MTRASWKQPYVYNEAGQLIGEYGTDAYGSSNTNRDHVWLDTLPIAILNKGDNASVINYVTADGLDTPSVITSSTSDVAGYACCFHHRTAVAGQCTAGDSGMG